MSDYVNKIQKGEDVYDIQDARIAELSDVKSELDGTSLVIPASGALEPVINIDGVDYYHQQVFDLEAIIANAPEMENGGTCFNLLTGEEVTSSDASILGYAWKNYPTSGLYALGLRLDASYFTADPKEDCVMRSNAGGVLTYTSHAFTVVDTLHEATNNTKICLPTCSAYYGYLSEDRSTFISYFNLKGEGAPTKVNSVKQGNSVLPIVDERIPEAAIADEGKVIKVGATGEFELGTAGGGGTQLYEHRIQRTATTLTFISTDGTANSITGFIKGTTNGGPDSDNFVFINSITNPAGTVYVVSGLRTSDDTLIWESSQNDKIGGVITNGTDTVTTL